MLVSIPNGSVPKHTRESNLLTEQKKNSEAFMAKRIKKWGVVINPPSNELNWNTMTQSEIVEGLQELGFIQAPQLHTVLKGIKVQGRVRPKNKQKDNETHYVSRVAEYVGQLEQGDGGTVHWQLAIELSSGVTKTQMLDAIANAIYGTGNREAISIQHDSKKSELKDYCVKEGRLELPAPYGVSILDQKLFEYLDYLEENPHVKKYQSQLGLTSVI